MPEVSALVAEADAGRGSLDLPGAHRASEIHKRAYDEGFAVGREEGQQAGHSEGIAAAQTEYRDKLDTLNSLFVALAKPLERLDEELEQNLVALVTTIARHMIRRELRLDAGEVVAVAREAIGHLPIAARNPRVRLNPEDVELVTGALSPNEEPQAYTIDADPLISRGGCFVETDSSFVDATVETRLAAIINAAMGGERDSDHGA